MALKRGSKGSDVRKLQEGLRALGFNPGMPDGDFGPVTEMAVEAFQKAHGLLTDGIAGPITLHTYHRALEDAEKAGKLSDAYAFSLGDAAPQPGGSISASGEKLTWVRCPADKFPGRGGYTYLHLREDAAAAHLAMYDEVHSHGGIVTTAGGKRPLTTGANASRSRTSFHYTGLAFDLSTETGMRKPDVDPYVIEQDAADSEGRSWIVWVACDDNTAIPEMTVPGVYVTSQKDARGCWYTRIHYKDVTRRLVNFTDLAAQHGFLSIRARRSFLRGGSYMGAEWWHFQRTATLTQGVSTFGGELLRVYTQTECQQFVYWNEVKDSRFGVEWF